MGTGRHDNRLDPRDRLARFMWGLAADETGGRSWDEAQDNDHLKNCYRLVAEMAINLLPLIIRRTQSIDKKDEREKW